jgi:hypothetical protein
VALTLGCAVAHGQETRASLTGSLEFHLELDMEHATTIVGCEHGQGEADTSRLPDWFELEWKALWEDGNRSASDSDHPTFDRTYQSLGLLLAGSGQEISWERSLASPLEGIPHRWQWDSEDGDYSHQAPSEPVLEKALDSLASDLSFSWVLPARGLSEKEQDWELAPEDLIGALWPGGFGALGFLGRDRDTGDLPMVHVAVVPGCSPNSFFWPSAIDGSVKAKRAFGKPGQVAIIDLEYTVTLTTGVEDWLEQTFSDSGQGVAWSDWAEFMSYEGEGVLLELRGEGRVEWSVEGGYALSVEWSGTITAQTDLRWSYLWDTPQIEELSGERSESWTGRFELAGTFESSESTSDD